MRAHTHLYGTCDFGRGFAFREPFDDCADCLLDVLFERELRDLVQECGYGRVLVQGRAEFDEESRVSLERGVEFLAESLCGRVRRGPVSCVKVWLVHTRTHRAVLLCARRRP